MWICLLRQSPQRPPADHVQRQALFLLDELRGQPQVQAELPAQAIDDGLFAIAALLDEVAMYMPDLRPLWSARPLQAIRWTTNNAGEEVFQRLARVRKGPKSVVATYYVVLACGFQGRYAIPGAVRYELEQLRRDLGRELGVDPDRDWKGGVLRKVRDDEKEALAPKASFVRSQLMGRVVGGLVAASGLAALAWAISEVAR